MPNENDYNRFTVDGHSYHNSEARLPDYTDEPLSDVGELKTLADLLKADYRNIYTRSLSKADREDRMARAIA